MSTVNQHNGTYAAQLSFVGSLGYLSQTVVTTPGQAYQLTFWLAHDLGGSSGEPSNAFRVMIDGGIVYDQVDLGSFSYTLFTFSFTATGSTTTIELGFREDYGHFSLDDVIFEPV